MSASTLMSTRPSTVTVPLILAHLDPDETAIPTRNVRAWDYHDDVLGAFVYIGEDAAVLVEDHMAVARLERLVMVGGVHARRGIFPVEFGIAVMPHTGHLSHPACNGTKHVEAHAAWRIVQDTLIG